MLYKTHKAAGLLGCLIAFDIMKNSGQLAPNINEFVQLAIIYPACSWASTAPDLDHALCNVKEQTPINIAINKLLHIGKCTHRSVQTHSVLFTGGFCLLLFGLLQLLGGRQCGIDENSLGILQLMLLGVTFGIASHLVMDCLTTAGIWLVPNVKFRLVPNSKMFATGGKWEDIIRIILYVCIIYMVIHLVVRGLGYSLTLGSLPIL